MQLIEYPLRTAWPTLLTRPVQDLKAIKKVIKPILKKVDRNGDRALLKLTEEFDHVVLDKLMVSPAELAEAEGLVAQDLKQAIQTAKANVERFHSAQHAPELVVETMPGVTCRRKSVAIEKVGLYVPGGTAPLFSSVLMLAVPANLAGCREIILCTPPNKEGKVHPAILYTASLCGVNKIFKVGGAQAIAAMAYGTESIPKAHKIFGPGNQYVTAAKQVVSNQGLVSIDMPAGPSEVAVLADASANPAFVAVDLLSQAEHGADSQVLMVTTHQPMLEAVQQEVERQVALLPRAEMARKALNNSLLIVVKDTDEAMDLLNAYAPEHLILAMDKPEEVTDKIINAGSVFMGHLTPESAGDYASGTNHTLPTNGYAVSYSGVSLDSFVKKITFQQISPEGLRNLGPTVEKMAAAEELTAHKEAVTLRLAHLEQPATQPR